MSDYADTGTSREGDPYAEIAALKADLARAVELLREVRVQYECTDFNVTSDLYEKARAYLDLVARDPADTGTSREGDPYAEIAALRAELERKDAALKDFAAAWREVAHRSGVKLEAWEDDEYILSAPERGPCGMTIHRRHATVLNAALQPKEPPCQKA